MTADVTDQDRILSVAHALLEFDGHEPTGMRMSAAILEATRMCLAWSVLRQLEPPAPPKRRSARRPVEH